MNGNLSQSIADAVQEAVTDAVASGAFDAAISGIIVDTVRRGSDHGLSFVGFHLKMAVEMIDRCSRPITLAEAKRLATRAYDQFRRDNSGAKFGDPEFDWSGDGARTIAREYEIFYWEQAE